MSRNHKFVVKKLFYAIVFSLSMLNLNCNENNKETIGSVTALAGSITSIPLSGPISSIIGKFESAAKRLLLDGENTGNALLSSMGNQLQVATQNAKIAFSDELDQTFDNLDKTGQSYFTQLNLLLKDVNGTANRAISVLEVANLNLLELTNRLPLTNKVYTYINKVEGLTQIYQSTDYKISFSGLGLGQNSDDVKYKWTVKIGDITLPSSSLSRVPPYELTVKIDHKLLERYFNDSKYNFVPIVITSNIDAKTKCGLIFNCHNTSTSEWNLQLTLLPKYPGILTGVEILRGEALDGVTLTKSVDVSTPESCSNDEPCDWVREIRLASNERVLGVRISCAGGPCGWNWPLRAGHETPDYDILEGGTLVKVYRHVNAGPMTITHYVDYQTLKQYANEKTITPIRLKFSTAFQVPLSQENTSCTYRLKAKLITGQEFYIDNSMTESNDKLLTRKGTGEGPAGLTCSPSFTLNIP